ncbi:GNAT family N-acetyltransferase [Sabulilitoribacter multivorans]|uniref:GNAT family N-acetyltransferase n=1 Tax=Flaviramulus multivorans TaxID=1304750 RepID=A0ABS9IJN3_9FLAO|nr:GNAT family N-acetyltransferase [Flaviramulus multivorans]MCF7560795.1 GNAT family N-acetyltransferase [Flaviramulus multivorans]
MRKRLNISFLKAFLFENSLPPIYTKILDTNGYDFNIKKNEKNTSNKHIVIVKDIPDYFTIETAKKPKTVLKRIKTLKGHLVELDKFKNIEDYLNNKFSSKSRSNLRRYVKRLETCFNIKCITYYGDISREEYNRLFVSLKELLIKRFKQKQETNYELQHLDEYQQIVYDMLLRKEASLFVIYDNNNPISIRINMFKGYLAYYILSGYDTDYSKFHLGSIDMLKNIEWCINKRFKVYDLLKGYDYYKSNWATKTHYYYNHIIYSINSIKGYYTSIIQKVKYYAYNVLKHYNLIQKYKRVKKIFYGFKHKSEIKSTLYTFKEINIDDLDKKNKIDIDKNDSFLFLRRPVYDFLFLNSENKSNITVSELINSQNTFIIQSRSKCFLLKIGSSKK